MESSVLNRGIFDDIEAGDEFITISQATKDKRLKVDGRSRHPSWAHRAAMTGMRGPDGTMVILESEWQSGRKHTTPSAIARFVYRMARGNSAPAVTTKTESDTAHQEAERRLAARGL